MGLHFIIVRWVVLLRSTKIIYFLRTDMVRIRYKLNPIYLKMLSAKFG